MTDAGFEESGIRVVAFLNLRMAVVGYVTHHDEARLSVYLQLGTRWNPRGRQ